jgi:hypothetical protein
MYVYRLDSKIVQDWFFFYFSFLTRYVPVPVLTGAQSDWVKSATEHPKSSLEG